MGASIKVSTRGFTGLQRKLAFLGKNDRSAELLDSVGALIESQTRRRIHEEKTAPDGEAWAPWSPVPWLIE